MLTIVWAATASDNDQVKAPGKDYVNVKPVRPVCVCVTCCNKITVNTKHKYIYIYIYIYIIDVYIYTYICIYINLIFNIN